MTTTWGMNLDMFIDIKSDTTKSESALEFLTLVPGKNPWKNVSLISPGTI